ncbi:MAG: ABC transporter ATP-binding protein [Oscillospiraceae bacterium]|nr:ABC transporter ATP-binding protein [Oscillospiraceae bacterium]
MKLEIKDLSVSLQAQPILRGVSLTVEEGEFVSLLGHSGCGKSTLLKTVAGILPPDGGSILLGGEEITKLPAHRRGTVIVFQDMRLFPHMTAAENVAFPLKMQGVSKAERLRTAEELLEKVQLPGLGQRRMSELSGGQQQRVALARALAAKPKLLLLDEPFSSLDENLREEMRSLVAQLHREFGMTTVLVTHDREEALAMSHRVAVMSAGKILQYDVPEEVYRHPANRTVADYFGDCCYLGGRVEHGRFVSELFSCEAALPDGRYDLMLRAGAIRTEQVGALALTVRQIQFRGVDTLVTLEAGNGQRWKCSLRDCPAWSVGETISCDVALDECVFFSQDNRK